MKMKTLLFSLSSLVFFAACNSNTTTENASINQSTTLPETVQKVDNISLVQMKSLAGKYFTDSYTKWILKSDFHKIKKGEISPLEAPCIVLQKTYDGFYFNDEKFAYTGENQPLKSNNKTLKLSANFKALMLEENGNTIPYVFYENDIDYIGDYTLENKTISLLENNKIAGLDKYKYYQIYRNNNQPVIQFTNTLPDVKPKKISNPNDALYAVEINKNNGNIALYTIENKDFIIEAEEDFVDSWDGFDIEKGNLVMTLVSQTKAESNFTNPFDKLAGLKFNTSNWILESDLEPVRKGKKSMCDFLDNVKSIVFETKGENDFYFNNQKIQINEKNNKIILTLANGKTIEFDSLNNRILVNNGQEIYYPQHINTDFLGNYIVQSNGKDLYNITINNQSNLKGWDSFKHYKIYHKAKGHTCDDIANLQLVLKLSKTPILQEPNLDIAYKTDDIDDKSQPLYLLEFMPNGNGYKLYNIANEAEVRASGYTPNDIMSFGVFTIESIIKKGTLAFELIRQ